ncbi:MAG: hypothetical protein ACPGVG_02505, partial [Mycobacterium sp.]
GPTHYTVTDLSTNATTGLRGVLGYWDDSGAARVAGSAVAGDTVTLALGGTQDLGATDNILYPAAGVTIIGPGASSLTIIGRLFSLGTGGVSVVSRLEGWTLAPTGLASIHTLGLGGGDASVCGVQDVSLVYKDWRCYDSAPASSSNNLFTNWSESGDPTICLRCDSEFEGAGADAYSTKGDGLRTARDLGIGNLYKEWGSGTNNNGATAHDAWEMFGWGNQYRRSSAAGIPLSHASNAGTTYEANADIEGGTVQGVGTLINSRVNLQDSAILNAGSILTLCQGVKFLGAEGKHLNTIAGAQLTDVAFTDYNGGGGGYPAIQTIGTPSGAINLLRCVFDGYRGLDTRGGTGDGSIVDSIFKTTSFTALKDGGTYTTSGNQVSAAGHNIPFTGTGDVIGAVSQGTVDDAIAVIDAMFNTAAQPDPNRLASAILAGNGAAILAMTPGEIAYQFAPISGLHRVNLRGLRGRPRPSLVA